MTDKQVIIQTNILARAFYKAMGYDARDGFAFYKATHPQEQMCWRLACIAFEQLKNTDVSDALVSEGIT